MIPEPLPVDWPMRTLDTARIVAGFDAEGRYHQKVEHAPLPGVTPTMCLWFLERVDRSLTWRGITSLAYRFWHPVDHISFVRHGSFGPGDRWHITEAFGGDRRFLLDETFHVTRLGEEGFGMEIRKLGRPVATIDERWCPSVDGLIWTVEMTLGSNTPVLKAISRQIVNRRMDFLERWRQHNVEEAGNLPRFLPELYAEQGG